MKISGFTFSKNGNKLYYPIIESILSIIGLVDEFVVVLGDSEVDDTTELQIRALNNAKIKQSFNLELSNWQIELEKVIDET